MTDATRAGDDVSAKAWYTLSKAVYDKFAAMATGTH